MKRLLVVALLLVGLSAPAFAGVDRSDYEVFRAVAAEVNRYASFSIFDNVTIEVDAGVVTLAGKVTMPFKATDIEKRVAKVSGVTSVKNAIEVLPVSRADGELRYNIARAIYSHPALAMYGIGANPSIHVIVERGRVTLDGVVDFEMDKIIATMLVRSFPVFEVTNNLKTGDEVTQMLEKLK